MDDSPLQTSGALAKSKADKDKDKDKKEKDKDKRKDNEKEKEVDKEKERDGYSLLVEKMEQVRSQMIKMERKYDELYKTFKEKDHAKVGSTSPEQTPPKDFKSPKESGSETSLFKDITESPAKMAAQPIEEKPPPKQDLDIEKLEDNPFL